MCRQEAHNPLVDITRVMGSFGGYICCAFGISESLFLFDWVSRIDRATRKEREGKKQGDGIQQYMMRVSNPIIMVVVVAVIDGRISRRGGRTFLR